MTGLDSGRRFTQELTPEFLREFIPDDDPEAVVESAVERFEGSYNAVAWVEPNTNHYGDEQGLRVQVIRGREADPDAINHGIQHIFHWVSEADHA